MVLQSLRVHPGCGVRHAEIASLTVAGKTRGRLGDAFTNDLYREMNF